MSVWKKTMFYLGLGPDDDYEGAPPPSAGVSPEEGRIPPGGSSLVAVQDVATSAEPSAVRALGPMEDSPEGRLGAVGAGSTPLSGGSRTANNLAAAGSAGSTGTNASSSGASSSGINTVRPLPASNGSGPKPHVVSPRAFNDAQEVADRFRGGAPVIMNLQEVERDLSRRLIDFASGMCYGLAGQMEKVAEKVYLLTPANVELTPEDRRDLHEQGLHNG